MVGRIPILVERLLHRPLGLYILFESTTRRPLSAAAIRSLSPAECGGHAEKQIGSRRSSRPIIEALRLHPQMILPWLAGRPTNFDESYLSYIYNLSPPRSPRMVRSSAAFNLPARPRCCPPVLIANRGMTPVLFFLRAQAVRTGWAPRDLS